MAHDEMSPLHFLGTYRPQAQQVGNGCPELGLGEGSLGLNNARLTPMGDGRALAVAIPAGDGSHCSLQVWSLHGAYP
jgi:hypothetical protein